ncbi:KAP family P-loop domain-containing protein [Oribacterium sp. KHPX15]|uniref:KAP family P-loop NTPase fold protein n=1 Tax=Oribacterium sp. KHPX15 TaxID=1855342 RepID=UPI00089B43D8|nr:P-loop NTPase fold protein [Oribacterium sp. KHPX15]SEA36952.1 KAP family P-loop domain-containing protein [Oribacterium sp. KHPX15]
MKKSLKGCDDKASQKDLFNIQSYTNGLAQFIKTCKTPMTIAIQGDWGSGKTSMMNRLNDIIGESAFCTTINTWQYSQFDLGNQLSISFLRSILNALEADPKKTTVKKLKGTLGIISKHLLKNAAFQAIDIVPYGEVASKAMSSALEEIKKNKEQETDDLVKAIDSIRDDIQKAINEKIEVESEKKKKVDRVVFFIDDLDRLKPGKAVELMEVMKVLLECENCIFILAIDYNVVVSGIKEKYGSDFDKSKAKNFFDKIIQLPFYLPVGSYDIENYIKELTRDTDGTLLHDIEEEDIPTIVNLIKTSVECNPRSIKRVINSYILARVIFENENNLNKQDKETGKRINMIIFGASCLHLAYEEVYDKLLSVCDVDNIKILNEFFEKISDDENYLKGIKCDLDSEKSKENLIRFMDNLKQCIKGNKDYEGKVDSDQENEKITDEEMQLLRKALKSSSTTSSIAAKSQENDDGLKLKKLSYVYEVLNSLDKEAIKTSDDKSILSLISEAKKEVATNNNVLVSTVSDKTTRRLGIESSKEFAELTRDFFNDGDKLLEKIKNSTKNQSTKEIDSIFNSLRD